MTLHLVEVARRFQTSIRPVDRIKHVVDAEGSVTTTQAVVPLIETVDAPVIASTTQVQTGSKVNGIYLKVEATHTSGVGRTNLYMAIFKNAANDLTPPQANAVGGDKKKRFVIHQEMVMLSDDASLGNPRVLFNGVIVIPKGMRRNGPDDKLQMLIRSGNAPTFDWCLQCHYKEFR